MYTSDNNWLCNHETYDNIINDMSDMRGKITLDEIKHNGSWWLRTNFINCQTAIQPLDESCLSLTHLTLIRPQYNHLMSHIWPIWCLSDHDTITWWVTFVKWYCRDTLVSYFLLSERSHRRIPGNSHQILTAVVIYFVWVAEEIS